MKRLGYVPALDGIRGLAIVLVIAQHYFSLRETGAEGVELFFVLSGFLITTLLLDERDRAGAYSFRRFYVRRAQRLLPALGALLVVYLALRGGAGVKPVLLAGLYFGNFVAAFWGSPVPGLLHLWSLAEEEQFYLVWPLLLGVLLRRRHPQRSATALLAALLAYDLALGFTGIRAAHALYGPDTNSAYLLAGCLLAFLRRRGVSFGDLTAAASFITLMLVAALDQLAPNPLALQPLVIAACAGLVGAAYCRTRTAAFLSVRPLSWLGRISYSLYLWHPLLLILALGHPLIALPLSLLTASLSHKFIEQPFRRPRGGRERPPTSYPASATRWS